MNQKPLVLVVDDEVSHLRLTELMLAKAGYETVTAEHPRDALELLRSCTPDLIVMDIHMPGLTGIDLGSRIRGVSRLRQVPIILVTSQLTPEVKELARWEGMHSVLEKPLSMATFRRVVREALAVPNAREVEAA